MRDDTITCWYCLAGPIFTLICSRRGSDTQQRLHGAVLSTLLLNRSFARKQSLVSPFLPRRAAENLNPLVGIIQRHAASA